MDSSIYGSLNFYGPPGVSRGGATPSVLSLAGSQQVSSSMWPLLGLTPMHSMQTAEQSAKIFKIFKQFQTISGLEAIHRASTQATAYETTNRGWMVCNATFSPLTGADNDAVMQEETRWWIHTKADKTWKDTHYDRQLAAFIGDTDRTLQEKWGEIWEHIC